MAIVETLEDHAEPETPEPAPAQIVPFLRITATYPSGSLCDTTYPNDGSLYETIVLELSPQADEQIAETVDDNDDDDAEGSALFKSWFTDFCTQVLRELRSRDGVVVMSGRLRDLYAQKQQDEAGVQADGFVAATTVGGA